MPATLIPMTDPIMVSWGRHLGAKGRSTGTIEMRQRYVCRMLDHRNPASVTTADIEEWLAGFPEWAPETRRSAIASLRSFYAWWCVTHPGAVNPAGGLEAPGHSEPCPKPCPDAVFEAALERARGDRWWLLRIAGSTGLRRAELAGLSPRMVEGQFLRIRGKGNKTRRVPIQTDVQQWLSGRGPWAFPSRYSGHGHVEPDAVGRRIARALGQPWTAHTLRHRFATVTYRACGNLTVVMRLLGHSSLATTERYLATGDDDLLSAVAWAERPTLQLVG